MLPPKLNTAQLRALAIGDLVSRVVNGCVETGPVIRLTTTEIVVEWPSMRDRDEPPAHYYNESGSRIGTPLEVLRVAPVANPWLERMAAEIDAEMTQHRCTDAERRTLLDALPSPGTAAHALVSRCSEARMNARTTAALLVGLVLYDRLRAGAAAPTDFPDPFKAPKPACEMCHDDGDPCSWCDARVTVPDWAQAVACG